MQNQKFVAPGGDKNNRTVAEAQAAERLYGKLGIQSLGIVAFAHAGQERVDMADFGSFGIDPALPANLQIRTSPSVAPDGTSSGQWGEFVDVDKSLDWLSLAQFPDQAAERLLVAAKPGLTAQEIQTRLMNLPGVAKAYGAAVRKALEAV
jgi:hypothetical protein